MDIGTLTGEIVLEDKVSDVMDTVSEKVRHFASKFEGDLGIAILAAGAFVAAVGTVSVAILALGSKGSTILDVEAAFDRLARAAGSTGEALGEKLNEGLRGTMDSMAQMQAVMKPLTAGAKLTGEDMKIMGEAARALGKATGQDARVGLDALSSALTTGRTRSLAMQGIIVDVVKAETDFAKSIGTTRDQLNEVGKLEAHRIGILQATKEYVDRLGVSQLSFKEKIQQTQIAIGNWFDDLSKAVASSPNISRAWDAIGDALQRNFGGAGKTALEIIVGWINKFADAVAYWGPRIIDTVSNIYHWIVDIIDRVRGAWDLVPEWFKRIATDATLAGGAVYLVSKGLGVVAGPDVLGTIASFATITSGLRDFTAVASSQLPKAITYVKEVIVALALSYQLGGLPTLWAGITSGIMYLAATPVGIAALFTGLAAALWQVYKAVKDLYQAWQSGKSMWDFFTAKDDNTFLRRWLGLSKGVDTATEALKNNRAELEKLMKSHGVGDVGPERPAKAAVAPNYLEDNSKKILDATQASYKRMADLSGEYFALQDKMDGDHLENRFNSLDEEYRKEKATLDETFAFNKNYNAELEQLTDNYLQKRLAAEVEYKNKSIETSRAVGLAAQDFIGKSLLGMPNIVRELSAETAVFEKTWTHLDVPIKNVDTGLMEVVKVTQTLVSGSILASKEIKGLNTNAHGIATTYTEVEKVIAAATQRAARDHLPLSSEQKKMVDRMKEAGATSQEMADAIGVSLSRIEHYVNPVVDGFQKISSVLETLQSNLVALADVSGDTFGGIVREVAKTVSAMKMASDSAVVFLTAIKNKDKVGTAAGVLGLVTATTAATAPNAYAGTGKGMAVGVLSGAATGALAGAAIGSVVPVIGTAIGAGVGAIYGGIMGFVRNLGPSAAEKAARTSVADFEKSMGGWKGIQKALLETGMTAEQTNAKIEEMWKAEKLGAEATEAAIGSITSALDAFEKKQADIETGINDIITAGHEFGHRLPADIRLSIKALMDMKGITDQEKLALQQLLDQGPTFDDVTQRASKFGITLGGLGKKFQQSDIEGRSKELTDLFTDITDLGGDIGGALSEASASFSTLVNDAKKSGLAIPENMRPYLEELARAGKLVDDNGDKIGDLTGITFEATPLDTSMDKLTKAIQHLSDIFEGIPGKIDNIGSAASRLPDNPFGGWDVSTPEEPIRAAHGFRGRVSSPTLFMAGEGTGAEDVFIGPAGKGGGGKSGPTNITFGDIVLPQGTNVNDPKAIAEGVKVALRQDTGLLRTAVEGIVDRRIAAA